MREPNSNQKRAGLIGLALNLMFIGEEAIRITRKEGTKIT